MPPLDGCGDGNIDTGETCDDGNQDAGDGCSNTCTVEPGGNCPTDGSGNPIPGTCTRCGNGTTETGETCDDGQSPAMPGDGCDDACQLEPGAVCNDAAGECWICGNLNVASTRLDAAGNADPETCDDGRQCDDGSNCSPSDAAACGGDPAQCTVRAGDGCDASCHAEAGWECPTTSGVGGLCTRCGDGVREGAEQCDTGGWCGGVVTGDEADRCNVGDAAACGGVPGDCMVVAGDGCSATCDATELYWRCTTTLGARSECALCGNGAVSGTLEQCDDGGWCGGVVGDGSGGELRCTVGDDAPCAGNPNGTTCEPVGGDGCSQLCIEEGGWNCPDAGGECAQCGDGVVGGSEQCDDGGRCTGTNASCAIGDAAACGGNPALCTLRNADGCTTSCNLELGWTCDASSPQVCGRCGDGVIQAAAGETCDDRGTCQVAGGACTVGNATTCGGNPSDCQANAGDGCSDACVTEGGWSCYQTGTGTVCQQCGDGVVQGTETCDTGALGVADGCSDVCAVETNYSCDTSGVPTVCHLCGNGVREGAEACDDGDLSAGDGCNSSCQEETGSGWTCVEDSTATSVCSRCGDGLVQQAIDPGNAAVLGETCDDSDSDPADGCNACQTDVAGGWTCTFNAGTGLFTGCKLCGNGTIELDEQCDTGALGTNDGCTDACVVDSGWTCQSNGTGGSVCANCGDGTVQAPIETCDLGATTVSDLSDGCTATCKIDTNAGWHCNTAGTACELCGDGNVDAAFTEVCDDGNRASGDGCNLNCQPESGWLCAQDSVTGESFCSSCGNGIVESTTDSGTSATLGETCDDKNGVTTDGCISCQVDAANGWQCTTNLVAGLPLHARCFNCGDGYLQTGEQCDDGDSASGDGCSGTEAVDPAAHCQVESGDGWVCESTGAGGVLDPVSACANCGDGTVQTPVEECDLGATTVVNVADGCTASCQIDSTAGWTCTAGGTACAQCGDGTLQASFGEVCDDGNRFSGDGCAFNCQLEANAVCWRLPSDGVTHAFCAKCGDGRVTTQVVESQTLGETCDDRNTASLDGCAGTGGAVATWCQEEAGYQCHLPGFACAQCGNGVLQVGEECDDGQASPQPGDGCDARCQLETGNYDCTLVGSLCTVCGDGTAEGNEECDDNNLVSDDGCSSLCLVEDGYTCDPPTTCSAAGCGDGVVAGAEECDDGVDSVTGVPVPGDGCSILCKLEDGYVCPAGVCRLTVCGDGALEGDEQCDDGNAVSSDGCTACVVDPGYACPTPGQLCVTGLCGNDTLDAGEECDDAFDATAGTYCDQCKLQPLSYCEIPGDDCDDAIAGDCDCMAETCGNGMRRGHEECDDVVGTPVDGDGCSSICEVEPLWYCTEDAALLSTCQPVAEFVEVLQFTVASVSANGIFYDPRTRSFVAYKPQQMTDPLELCLDGSVIDAANGTVTEIDGTVSTWTGGFRPRSPASALDASTYNQFNGTVLYLEARSNDSTLHIAPVADLNRTATSSALTSEISFPLLTDRGLNDDLVAGSMAVVGEDGRLYVAEDDGTRRWCRTNDATVCTSDAQCGGVAGSCVTGLRIYIFEDDPTCDGSTGNVPGVDCSGFVETSGNLVAVDSFGVNSNGGGNALDIGFTIPGAGIFGTAFQNADAPVTCPIGGTTTCAQYHFFEYDATLNTATGYTNIFASSSVPGTLFVDTSALQPPGSDPLDSILAGNNPVDGSETATDGGAFVVCSANPSDSCRLYSRSCETDADCQAVVAGTTCYDPNPLSTTDVKYCVLQGQARDDRYTFTWSLAGTSNLDVMENDVLSQNVCSNRAVGIRSLSVASTSLQTRLTVHGTCSDGTTACQFTHADVTGGTVDADCAGTDICLGEYVDYDYPATCGTNESFQYTALLGGGESDTATVRISPNCVCGDGVVAANEQCDPGCIGCSTLRCSSSCTLNVVCGDSLVDPGEDCDDGATCTGGASCDPRDAAACGGNPADCTPDNGDGCSATCVAEYVCGNGLPEFGEPCDDGNLLSEDGCSSQCQIEDCGDDIVQPGLGEECEPPGVGSCDGFCSYLPVCGDVDMEGAEECDDGGICDDGSDAACAVGLTTCPMGGTCVPTSNDGCSASCELEFCGDGVLQAGLGEQCDFVLTPATCSFSCTTVTCGDGVVTGSETCDDGGWCDGNVGGTQCTVGNDGPCGGGTCLAAGNDGCTATCQTEYCGDGTENGDAILGADECDDGNNVSGDGCSATCRDEYCGDGVVNYDTLLATTDQCDDGNGTSGDGCSTACLVEYCGDGTVQAGIGEECEPGEVDLVTGAVCQGNCQWGNVCGDGAVGGDEQCDDGNAIDCDSCRNDCSVPACGNGVTECGEQCDGTASDPDCTASCTIDRCGNGVLNAGAPYNETCDDGNDVSGDGCSAACQDEWVCGDGDVDPGELCDPNDPATAVDATTGAPCSGSTCAYQPICGDGTINQDYLTGVIDQCDQGVAQNGQAGVPCSATCVSRYCGDGVVAADLGEQCEVGMPNCSAVCTLLQFCGNGVTEPTNPAGAETCDDGMYPPASNDGCNSSCQIEYCGDGIIQSGIGENCEPSDPGTGAGCSAVTCTRTQVCGNNVVEGTEECDDGDLMSGDGCNSSCEDEFCGDGIVQPALGEECEPPDGTSCALTTCTVITG